MNERIKELRKALGLTQQEFADRIGMKRNTVANYESDRNEPSASVIALIVREFNVNEAWLRTGDGEMFRPVQDDERIADFVGRVFATEDESFKRRFLAMLSGLTDEQWELLREKAEELAGQKEKD